MPKAAKIRIQPTQPDWEEELADSTIRQRTVAHDEARNERVTAAIARDPKAHQAWLKAQRTRFAS